MICSAPVMKEPTIVEPITISADELEPEVDEIEDVDRPAGTGVVSSGATSISTLTPNRGSSWYWCTRSQRVSSTC